MIPSIMGGMLPLAAPLAEPLPPPWLDWPGQILKFANTRSALWYLAQCLQPQRVWLPAYLCPVILPCFATHHVTFFPVTTALTVTDRSWLEQVQPGDLVLLIAYFGFMPELSLLQALQVRQAIVVLDNAQALMALDDLAPEVDYVVASPRKWLGIPDGGLLFSRQPLPEPDWQAAPQAWWQWALNASQGRQDFDRGSGSQTAWYEAFQQAEKTQPMGAYPMSPLSEQLLNTAVDWPYLIHQRRENYQILRHALSTWALFPDLPDNIVPFGFTLRVPNRDRLRTALIAQKIYPPIYWAVEGHIPETFIDAHQLSREIITLPCDQRYNGNEIRQMAHTVKALIPLI